MGKYQNFHVAQDSYPATITYRRFKKQSDAVLRAEGVTLETSTTNAEHANRGNDISHMVGANYDWTLFSSEDSNRNGAWTGSVSATDKTGTYLKLFFEPSVSDYDTRGFSTTSAGSFYSYGWPESDNTSLSGDWVVASSRMRVAELVIDLTKSPEEECKYVVMANVDLSCNYGMHPYYAECQVIKGKRDKAGQDQREAVNQSADGYNQSPESLGQTVYYSPVKNRQDHWQAAFPVTLKGGEFYRIPIIVGTYLKYYSWRGGTTESAGISRASGDTGGDNSSGDGWDFPPLEGATITARNAKLHAIRIDNATYAEASDGRVPSPGGTNTAAGFKVSGGENDKSDYTNFAKEDDGIVRKLEIDDSSMKGGDYLVLFSATLSNNDSENYSNNDRPLTSKVYFGKTTYWSSYNVHTPFIENAEIKWPGASSTPYSGWNQAGSTFAELDQVSIGYAGIAHFRSEDHADWTAVSTLKEELTFAIGGDAKTPSVKNYYICAIKLSDLGSSIDALGNTSQSSFDSFNSLSAPQDGHMDVSISSETQRTNFKSIKLPEGAEDIYAEDAVDHLDVSTEPRFNTTFKMVYTPDSLLDSNADNSSSPNEPTGNIADDNETVVRWANVAHDTDYHLEQTTAGRQGKSKHNRINGYAALDMKRQSTSVGGVQYHMSGDIVLNGDSTNFTNCIWWVVKLRRATTSDGSLYHDLDDDSRSKQSGDENFYLSRTMGGSTESGETYSNAGSNNMSEWRIKRGIGSTTGLYEQMVWYTDGKSHSLTYAQGLRESWADQEWRVICSRRISKTQCELYVNGRLMGVSTKFVHDSNGNNSGNYADRIGRIGHYHTSQTGEIEIAEMAVVDGETTDEEVAYHNQRLIDKYNINKYSDQKGFSSDQKYADVSWDTSITADDNRFRGDTYSETGNYLEIISHSGAEIEDRKDDTVVVTGASGSPTVDFATKEYGIYSVNPTQVHDSFSFLADVRHRGSNIGGHGKYSSSKNADDGFLGCRDYGYMHIFAIRDNEFTASGLGMTTSEFNAISVGDIFEITDDTNGFKDATYSDSFDPASDSEATTHIGGRIEVEIIEKLAKNSTLDGNDGAAVTLPNVDGDATSSIMISGSAGADHTSVFTFKVLRTYSDRDTLPFRAPRTIGQSAVTYTHSGTSYTTDFAAAGSTARFRKVRAAHRSPEVRPRFGDSDSNYNSRRPVYPPLDDSEYSMIYKSTGFREDKASLIDPRTWVVGSTGGQTGFNEQSTTGTGSNNIIADTDPFGLNAPIWNSVDPDSTADYDGGWNTDVFTIDPDKLYRFSVWVKRKVAGDGRFYFGAYGFQNSTNIGLHRQTSSDSLSSNRYFTYSSSGQWDSDKSIDQWYLVVGHIHPHDDTSRTDHADSGYYLPGSTTKTHTLDENETSSTAMGDLRWDANHNKALHRSYLWYSSDTSTRQQWAYPRVDLCDGTEPTISDLVNDSAPTANDITVKKWIDSSGRINEVGGYDPDGPYHLYNASYGPVTATGPTGAVAGAVHFTPTDNTSGGVTLSTFDASNSPDPDMNLTDQSMITWVINFDKKSGTWRHPLASNSVGAATRIIYFESRDSDGNGTLVFHNSGTIGSGGVQHEVRCEVTIPPDSWHTITFIQEDEGALALKDGRRIKFFLDGYEVASTIATEGQSGAAGVMYWEWFGKSNNWFLSAKVADIRIRAARSTASPAITSAGTYAEQQAVEMDLADTYNIITHRLHSSKYTSDPEIPNTPAGSTLLFHLKPDIADMEVHRTSGGTNAISEHGSDKFDSNLPVLSSQVSSATVAKWYDANSTSYTGGGVLNFSNSSTSTRPDFISNVCNGYPGVKFTAGDYLASSQNNQGSNSNLLGGTSKASGINLFLVVKPVKHYNTGVIACCQGINIGLGPPVSGTGYSYDASADAQATSRSNFTYYNFGDLKSSATTGEGSALIIGHSLTDNTTRDHYQYNNLPEAQTDNINSEFTSTWNSSVNGAKWPPFNGLPILHPEAYVISLNYNGAGEPIARLNGEIVMDYTSDSSGRIKYSDSMFNTGVAMLRDWHLGEGDQANELDTFEGYILEFAAYTHGTSGMTQAEHLSIVDYMLDKYQINSASRGPYYDESFPMGRGSSGEKYFGSTPGFWINSGIRSGGERNKLRLEARASGEARSLGFDQVKIYNPSYAWLKFNEPEAEVTEETPVSILVESDKALVLKRSWSEVSGSPKYYTAYIDEGHEVTGVLVNGVKAVRKKSVSDFSASGQSLAWQWSHETNTISVVLDTATANPNTEDYTVSVILTGYYSREAENIVELPMPTITTSTATSPSNSDTSTITKSVYPDIATEGQRVVPYEPRLETIPGYSQDLEIAGGSISVTSAYGGVSFAAGDGEFDADMAQKIFEGMNTRVYKGYSSLDARKDNFELLLEAKQGLPSLSKDSFSFSLFDAGIGFNDALSSDVFETNSDDTSNGVEKWSAAEYPIYFGRNYRVPAQRVTHAQLDRFSSNPGPGQTAFFKVSNHFYTLLDNSDGTNTCKGVYLNSNNEVPFQVTAAEQGGFSVSSLNNFVFADEAMRKAGLVGIGTHRDFLDTRGTGKSANPTTDYDSILRATTIYLDIEGVSEPNYLNQSLRSRLASRELIDTPGKCYRYLFENFPINKDEKNGFYKTTTASNYQPIIIDEGDLSLETDAVSIKLDPGTDMSNFDPDKGTKVLLAQDVNVDTEESRYFHGIVLKTKTTPSSDLRIWIQPQFIINDVRLDFYVSSSQYYQNKAKAEDIFNSGASVIVYEKFIGLPEGKINYESLRDIDKLYRTKQDTNAMAVRAVSFPVPVQAGFSTASSESLQGALSKVGGQFFTYYYIDKSGRAVVDVPNLQRRNLLSNPGFEKSNLIASRNDQASSDTTETLTSATSIKKIGYPWEQKNHAAIEDGSLSNDVLYTGKQSIILSSGTSKGFLEQSVPLSPGRYLFTSLIASSAGSSSSCALSVRLPDGDTPELFSNVISPSGKDWQRISLYFEVGSKGSGTALLRIYPNSTAALAGDETVTVRVDDCELYKISSLADENSADYFPVDFEEENYYETKVAFAKTPFLPFGAGYKIVNDTNAKSAGLAASESRASLESSGRLNLDEINAREGHDAIEVAAKATEYYSRMRARMAFDLFDFEEVPEVGDMIYSNPEGRGLDASDDRPFWSISSVDYQASKSANQVSVEALRQVDPVSDRSTLSGSSLPIGAILISTESACPTGFTLVQGYERQFIGQPEQGESPSSSENGYWRHTHTASHSHSLSNHTHTETMTQSGSASYSQSGLAFETAITPSSGTVNRIGASSYNHIHNSPSATATTGNPVSANVVSDQQNLKYSVNSASYVSVLLCRRSGDFVKASDATTATLNIPPVVNFGWEPATIPSGYLENTAMQDGSEALLIQARGGFGGALSSIPITGVQASTSSAAAPTDTDEIFVVQVSASNIVFFEPRRIVTASDSSGNQIMLMVFSANAATNNIEVYKMNGIEFDTSYSNTAASKFDYTGFPSAGWTISAPADNPGAKILNRGHHSHGGGKSGTNMLSDHTHVATHSHSGGTPSNYLDEHITGSSYITTYNSGKDLSLGKSQNTHSAFGATGNLPILFGSGQVDCDTNQMATAADYSILNEQHEWDSGSGHNKVDWNGNGTLVDDITDWTFAPNQTGTALSPYNHAHELNAQGAPNRSLTSSVAQGPSGNDSGGAKTVPPAYLLNWIKPAVDGSGDSTTADIPSGAIIFVDSSSCPSGYRSLSEASNLLIGVQKSGELSASTQGSSHKHSITAEEHSAVSHNHPPGATEETGRAMLPSGRAPKYRNAGNTGDWNGSYSYFTAFSNGDGSSSASLTSPILFPVDLSLIIMEGDPRDNSPAYPTPAYLSSVLSLFAGFVAKNEISGSNYNAATSSSESHFHNQLSTTGSSTVSLPAQTFDSDLDPGEDYLKPRYKELLACKKL